VGRPKTRNRSGLDGSRMRTGLHLKAVPTISSRLVTGWGFWGGGITWDGTPFQRTRGAPGPTINLTTCCTPAAPTRLGLLYRIDGRPSLLAPTARCPAPSSTLCAWRREPVLLASSTMIHVDAPRRCMRAPPTPNTPTTAAAAGPSPCNGKA
jgi:hypothetical protein